MRVGGGVAYKQVASVGETVVRKWLCSCCAEDVRILSSFMAIDAVVTQGWSGYDVRRKTAIAEWIYAQKKKITWLLI